MNFNAFFIRLNPGVSSGLLYFDSLISGHDAQKTWALMMNTEFVFLFIDFFLYRYFTFIIIFTFCKSCQTSLMFRRYPRFLSVLLFIFSVETTSEYSYSLFIEFFT